MVPPSLAVGPPPPNDKILRSPMRDGMRFDEEYRTDRAKFRVEYSIPSPGCRTAPLMRNFYKVQ